jgi:raffinose/stachyose/melibiose transport system substrate-binding protein
VKKSTQNPPVPTEKTASEISRRDALVTAAKVGVAGTAVAAGIGAQAGRGPSVVRASSTITLRFQHWNNSFGANPQWFKDILAGFTKLHPGVVVESDFITYAQYLPAFTSQVAAKTMPDIYNAATLTAQLGRSGNSIDYATHVPASFIKQFFPSPIRQFTYDSGKIYALPLNAQDFGMYYNTQIMSKLGLQPPETWDDLIAMTPAIRKAGYVPVSWGNALGNAGPDFVLPLVTQFGGDVYALDSLTQKGLSWDSKPVTDAFALLGKLNKANVFPEGVNGISQSPQSEVMFYHGQSAMHWDGTWFVSDMRGAAPKAFQPLVAVTKVPTVNKGGRHWCGDGSGEGVAVNAQGAHVDLALDFVKYLFSPAVYNTIVKNSQQFPSIINAQSMISDPLVRTMIGYLPDGTDHILYGVGCWNAVSNAATAVLAGALDPLKAGAKVQSDVLKARSGRH